MVDFQENVYNRRGGDGRDHIPRLPFWMALVRVAQLVLTLLVLCLSAYAGNVFGVGFFPGYGMSFFTFVWTIAFLAYIFVTPLWFPQFYLYWVHLGLECTTNLFWLVTFALLAQESAAWNEVDNFLGGIINDIFARDKRAIQCTKAAAGIGALNWALFILTLSVFGYFLHKHRVEHGAASGHRDVEAKGVEQQQVSQSAPVEMAPVGAPVQQYPQ